MVYTVIKIDSHPINGHAESIVSDIINQDSGFTAITITIIVNLGLER